MDQTLAQQYGAVPASTAAARTPTLAQQYGALSAVEQPPAEPQQPNSQPSAPPAVQQPTNLAEQYGATTAHNPQQEPSSNPQPQGLWDRLESGVDEPLAYRLFGQPSPEFVHQHPLVGGALDTLAQFTRPTQLALMLATMGTINSLDEGVANIASTAARALGAEEPAILKAAAIGRKVLPAVFTAQQVKGLMDAWPALQDAYRNRDWDRFEYLLPGAVVGGAAAGLGGGALFHDFNALHQERLDPYLGTRNLHLQAAEIKLRKMADQIKDVVPDRLRRGAISRFIDANGDLDTLKQDEAAANRMAAYHEENGNPADAAYAKQMAQEYQIAQNLSPAEHKVANELNKYYTERGIQGEASGQFTRRENYGANRLVTALPQELENADVPTVEEDPDEVFAPQVPPANVGTPAPGPDEANLAKLTAGDAEQVKEPKQAAKVNQQADEEAKDKVALRTKAINNATEIAPGLHLADTEGLAQTTEALSTFSHDPAFMSLATTVNDTVKDMADKLGIKLGKTGIVLDRNAQGLHLGAPEGPSNIFINPLEHLLHMMVTGTDQSVENPTIARALHNDPNASGGALLETVVHELAHNKIKGDEYNNPEVVEALTKHIDELAAKLGQDDIRETVHKLSNQLANAREALESGRSPALKEYYKDSEILTNDRNNAENRGEPGKELGEAVRAEGGGEPGGRPDDAERLEGLESAGREPQANAERAAEGSNGGGGGQGPGAVGELEQEAAAGGVGGGNGAPPTAPDEDEEYGVGGPEIKRGPTGNAYSKLGTGMRFSRNRVFGRYIEGEKLGYRYNTDILHQLTAYDRAFHRDLANRQFLEALTRSHAADGRPLASTSGALRQVESAAGDHATNLVHPDFTIDPRLSKEDIGRLGDVRLGAMETQGLVYKDGAGKYRWNTEDFKHIDDKALRKWTHIGEDTNGQPVMLQGDLRIHPEVADRVAKLVDNNKSIFRTNAAAQAFLRATKLGKETLLALSPFHYATIMLRHVQETGDLGTAVKALFKAPEIPEDNPNLRTYLRGGGMIHDPSGQHTFEEGLASRGGLVGKIPGIGAKWRQVSDYLFDKYIPSLKAQDAIKLVGKLREKHPEWGSLKIGRVAAEQVNAAYGGLNYEMLGRSAAAQDWASALLLAPDFLESQLRYGRLALSKPGGAARQNLLRLAMLNFLIAQTTNLMTTGRVRLDQPFGVVVPDKNGKERVVTMRTMPSDFMRMIAEPMNFMTYRLNPYTTRTALEAFGGGPGGKRTGAQQVHDFLTQLAPIPLQGPLGLGNPGTDTIENATRSIGVTAAPNPTGAEKLARQLASEGMPRDLTPAEKQAGRMIGNAVDGLRGGTMAPKDIIAAFNQGELTPAQVRRIFTESKMQPLQVTAMRLAIPDVLRVWKQADAGERDQLRLVLRLKLRYLRPSNYTPQQLKAIVGQVQKALAQPSENLQPR